MDDIHRKIEELQKHFESINSPDLTLADITSGFDDLPEYFWLNTEQLIPLSNDDLHRLLLDEFEQLDNKKLSQLISEKHAGMYLHKDTKDGIKELLADRRSVASKPMHWGWKLAFWLITSTIIYVAGLYSDKVRDYIDCKLDSPDCSTLIQSGSFESELDLKEKSKQDYSATEKLK